MTLEHERKRCPKCGHSNRAEAKICTECGYAFFLDDTSGVLRKRCPHCGFMNRMGAKVCSQCGSKFRVKLLTTRGRIQAQNEAQKWCPQCGAQRNPGAKVCSYCGYRFKEVKIQPSVARPAQHPPKAEPAFEAPISQADNLSGASVHNVAATPEVQAPPQQSEAPFEAPLTQASAQAEPAIQNVASAPPEPKAPDLSGEPAPYITQDELQRLRRMGGERPGAFVRLFKAIRDDKS